MADMYDLRAHNFYNNQFAIFMSSILDVVKPDWRSTYQNLQGIKPMPQKPRPLTNHHATLLQEFAAAHTL